MAKKFYAQDLAELHSLHYSDFLEKAAPGALAALRDAGIRTGVVLDLGCGGGQLSLRLLCAGFEPILPLVLEPVPDDIAARVANPVWRVKAEHWRDAEEDELRWDRWYSATQWWHDRTLDLGYLRHAPELAFWRIGNQVFFQWQADNKADGIPVWILPQGQISMAASSFEAAVSHFCEDLLWSMGNRVRSIQNDGWKRADSTLNVDELAQEQAVRREACHGILQERRTTDWRQIHTSLDVLLALMGEPMTNET